MIWCALHCVSDAEIETSLSLHLSIASSGHHAHNSFCHIIVNYATRQEEIGDMDIQYLLN